MRVLIALAVMFTVVAVIPAAVFAVFKARQS